MMKIGLAQVSFPSSAAAGVAQVEQMVHRAGEAGCRIVCFPESVIPGLRGVGCAVEAYDHCVQQDALARISRLAAQCRTAVILPMEWQDENGLHLVAFVIGDQGEILGYQTKNQIDPDEDRFGYVPGQGRLLFEVDGVSFGIVICHEGWRYPETVRWAALRGASIVFHPQFTGDVDNPAFYNHAMLCRSLENNIYFASVNYALPRQKSVSALGSPNGEVLAAAAPETEQLLVAEIDPALATRLLASRFHAHLL